MRVEADRQLLANRIARLQSEEVKAVRRIEETHRRTQEILSVKTRHQVIDYERQVARTVQDDEMEKHRQALNMEKDERKYKIVAARQAVLKSRKGLAVATKEEQSEHAMSIARSRGAEYIAAASKRNTVRQDQEEARDRKRREKELLVEHLNERAAAKRRGEEQRAMHYAEELQALQREEAELVQSLAECQEEHRQVFHFINSQLTQGSSQAST